MSLYVLRRLDPSIIFRAWLLPLTLAETRAVPLPQGVKLEDVKATFSGGILEVSVPLPARPEANVRKVQIEEPTKTAKSAA